MAKKGRFRLVAVLLLAIPLVAFCMLLALERSYADELNAKADRLEDEAHRNNFVLPRQREMGEDEGRSSKGAGQRAPLVEDKGWEQLDSRKDARDKNIHLSKRPVEKQDPQIQDFLSLSEPPPQYISQPGGGSIRPAISLLKERKVHELRVDASIRELWWYTRRQVKSEADSDPHKLKSLKNQYDVLRLNLDNMEGVGDLEESAFQPNWRFWQRNVSRELTQLMKRRIHYLQNPPDCGSAKKLVCQLAKTCGFGCQMHHVAYCFIMAYATERTLVLDSSNWRYSAEGWSAVFLPLSDTCVEARGERGGGGG